MCGIFAVVGDRSRNASKTIYRGLKRLEYRGYDSWGIAVCADEEIELVKHVGEIDKTAKFIKKLPQSSTGIGHTRWATTGAVTGTNAHPHYATDKSFALAQNGIVENYEKLKSFLKKKGYRFVTQTDTEVIVRLIEDDLKTTKDFPSAVRRAFLKLEGRNTIIALTKNGEVVAARNGSPLVVGLAEGGSEVFLSSDTLSFAPFASKLIVIENGQLVDCRNGTFVVSDLKTGKKQNYTIENVTIQNADVGKEGYKHFMLKEIHEVPFVIRQLAKQEENQYKEFIQAIKQSNNVYTIGSGTTGIAAAQIAFYLRKFAKVNAISLIGADARDYYDLFGRDDLIIAPSQSGETADVLEVLEHVKKIGSKIASFVNMPGSMMTRMSNYQFMTQAGPEICVLSTKVFVAQIVWGYLVAKAVSGAFEEARENLEKLSKTIEDYIRLKSAEVRDVAERLTKARHIFLMSKYENFQIAREGMVKIIEATYKHAHAIPAGDLKHYAITLMEPGVPVIAIVAKDLAKADMINAIGEVKARGAEVIGIAPFNHPNFDVHLAVPEAGEVSSILHIVPLQLLAYYIALKLGNSIDKPRNIAKSVTVK